MEIMKAQQLPSIPKRELLNSIGLFIGTGLLGFWFGVGAKLTTKDPKKVEAGKRLAAINHKKREAKKREEQAQLEKSGVNQYYGIRAVIALGVIGGLGYYIY